MGLEVEGALLPTLPSLPANSTRHSLPSRVVYNIRGVIPGLGAWSVPRAELRVGVKVAWEVPEVWKSPRLGLEPRRPGKVSLSSIICIYLVEEGERGRQGRAHIESENVWNGERFS